MISLRAHHLLMWLSILLDPIFPEYKIVKYSRPYTCWGIHKRRFIFSYKPLTHNKMVRRNDTVEVGCLPIVSYEILTFKKKENAESEIDRLGFGYGPITNRIWEEGIIVEENYGKSKIQEDHHG
jgi:hypothetical protein